MLVMFILAIVIAVIIWKLLKKLEPITPAQTVSNSPPSYPYVQLKTPIGLQLPKYRPPALFQSLPAGPLYH
jgi:hypothetical protein